MRDAGATPPRRWLRQPDEEEEHDTRALADSDEGIPDRRDGGRAPPRSHATRMGKPAKKHIVDDETYVVPSEQGPATAERLQNGLSLTVIEQRKVTMLIVAQLLLVTGIMVITYGSASTHRDAFNWKGAQIATAVIAGWFWIFLLISARAHCFSWIILFLWSVVMGLALGFVGVSAQSFVPLFFVIVQAVGAAVLCAVSCCSDYTFYYRLGGGVQLFVIGTSWITWWLTHFDGGMRTATYSAGLCALSFLISLWTLWVVRRTNGYPSGGETRRRALLNLYTLNMVSLCCARPQEDDLSAFVLVNPEDPEAMYNLFTGKTHPPNVDPALAGTYGPPKVVADEPGQPGELEEV